MLIYFVGLFAVIFTIAMISYSEVGRRGINNQESFKKNIAFATAFFLSGGCLGVSIIALPGYIPNSSLTTEVVMRGLGSIFICLTVAEVYLRTIRPYRGWKQTRTGEALRNTY